MCLVKSGVGRMETVPPQREAETLVLTEARDVCGLDAFP